MLLSFELSMPGVGSWNNKWSGEKERYIKIVKVGAKCLAKPGDYHYDFGDGWSANVEVKEISGTEARKLRKISSGFCGYDWMINEIRFDGKIKTLSERMLERQKQLLTKTNGKNEINLTEMDVN